MSNVPFANTRVSILRFGAVELLFTDFPRRSPSESVTTRTYHGDTLYLHDDNMQTIVSRAPLHAVTDLRNIHSHDVTRSNGILRRVFRLGESLSITYFETLFFLLS